LVVRVIVVAFMEVRLYYRELPVNSTLGRIAPGHTAPALIAGGRL
jgi:hypothetical protein